MSRLSKEIIVLVFLGALLFLFFAWIDAFEMLWRWSRTVEVFELDELFILFPVVVFLGAIFLFLRFKEIAALNREIEDFNEQLKTSQAQLVQSAKLASLGEMAAGVAHEINNPLGIINMAVDMSLIHLKKGAYDLIEQNLGAIKEQIQRTSVIVCHLREFGRDSSLEKHIDVDLNQIISRAFGFWGENFLSKNIVVSQELSENLPLVKGNAIELEQVFVNLFSNAKDALKNSREKNIFIRSFRCENFVILEIEDTGSGIPSSIKSKIFEPFFTTKKVGDGTGIGLSVSYKIIQNHKGIINVETEEGKGTKFIIQLPVSENT